MKRCQRPKREDHGAWLNLGSTYNIYKPTFRNKSARACQQRIKTWRDAQKTKREDHGAWINLGSTYNIYKPTLKNRSTRACQQRIKTWRDAQRTKREDHGAWLNLGSTYNIYKPSANTHNFQQTPVAHQIDTKWRPKALTQQLWKVL